MKAFDLRKTAQRCVLVVLLVLAFGSTGGAGLSVQGKGVYALDPPPFLGDAGSIEAQAMAFPDDEVGISAYYKASTTIDLNDVTGLYRTIETETADYVIGSVPVTNYPESEDVHVYVHTDGWILAYYLSADPVAKIYDWRAYHDAGRTSITTKLENTIAVVAVTAGVPFSGATYYDFRHPNATNLMLIVEWIFDSSDSFEVYPPGSYAYYERSWSLGATGGEGYYVLDGVRIETFGSTNWDTSQGMLTPAQLLPDQFHTVEIAGYTGAPYVYGGLALVYRVP